MNNPEQLRIKLKELVNEYLEKNPGIKGEKKLARGLKLSRPTIKRWAEGTSAPHPIAIPSAIQWLEENMSTES